MLKHQQGSHVLADSLTPVNQLHNRASPAQSASSVNAALIGAAAAPELDTVLSDNESENSFSSHRDAAEKVAATGAFGTKKKKSLGDLHAKLIGAGEFEAEKHFYPRVLNAHIHPLVSSFLTLGNERILARYTHLNPQVNLEALKNMLKYRPKYFQWAGSDLFNVTTASGQRQMIIVETNSCPSGQKSMPLLSELENDYGGYGIVIDQTFNDLISKADKSLGDLAVVYDKNPMEASGYAAVMADQTREPVWLVEFYDEDPDPPVRWEDGVMIIRDADGVWHSIRACFRYVTQKPWNRFPINSKTIVLNSIVSCLAGGRNKAMAARAYDFLNAELDGTGLAVRIPETIRNVTKGEIPLWLDSMGGHAVLKVPYSNAGQGVYTVTNKNELQAFMEAEHHYDKFIVQSLVGNASWSSITRAGKFYHVGTIPNKKNHTFVSDLRMMVCANESGFKPVAIYARRARKPLLRYLEDDPLTTSWEMLGTNLSVKQGDEWTTEAQRLLLMDRKDFNQLGLGVDDLIDAYIQTILSVIAIDKMAQRLMRESSADAVDPRYPLFNQNLFDFELFEALNPDVALLQEILHATSSTMSHTMPFTTPPLDPFLASDNESEASFSSLPASISPSPTTKPEQPPDDPGTAKPKQKRNLGNLSARLVNAGEFEAEKHFYPRVLNANIHPLVSSFLTLGNERIIARYTHLNPQVNRDTLQNILAYKPKYFQWAGSDLFNVTTASGQRQMIIVETNSCPSGQKSMPLLSELGDDHGGYGVVIDQTFREMIAQADKSVGALAVVYDKNPMEATGYACVMADHTREKVYLAEYYEDDANPPVRWVDGVLHVRDADGVWIPIRACFRYVTQKPWNRFPVNSKTIVLNSVVSCLAGGRNKAMAARAYEFLNAELDGTGLQVRIPETIRNVTKNEIPLWLDSMGGHAVLKNPYSNAGQGVYTITNKAELKQFMDAEHHYDKFIVQSLVGNASWSSITRAGKFYHVGTIPNKKNHTFVSDLRMMVCGNQQGFRPVAIYARRARKPLLRHLEDDPSITSWEMLGTNLSLKVDGEWTTEAQRLLLMDRKDFNQLGLGVDDLIDAYIQTVLSVIAIDKMAQRLMKETPDTETDARYPWFNRTVFDFALFEALNPDIALLQEILH
ncbi:hypothetical protein HDU83_001930 [Entophlyctis luteolus]|nr:hypothetical protein HDU83_001930 [Entophlyctis luteolus]KAJ3387280.1 hypothetical protein HDU84_000929 [Entophlyctis sp. JEL0112]